MFRAELTTFRGGSASDLAGKEEVRRLLFRIKAAICFTVPRMLSLKTVRKLMTEKSVTLKTLEY